MEDERALRKYRKVEGEHEGAEGEHEGAEGEHEGAEAEQEGAEGEHMYEIVASAGARLRRLNQPPLTCCHALGDTIYIYIFFFWEGGKGEGERRDSNSGCGCEVVLDVLYT